jgi:hypothetical protein
MNNRFISQFEITFPYFRLEWPQKAHELYERRRFVGFTTRRQFSRRLNHDNKMWRDCGMPFVDRGTKPFIERI